MFSWHTLAAAWPFLCWKWDFTRVLGWKFVQSEGNSPVKRATRFSAASIAALNGFCFQETGKILNTSIYLVKQLFLLGLIFLKLHQMLEKVGFAADPHNLEGFLGFPVEFLLIFLWLICPSSHQIHMTSPANGRSPARQLEQHTQVTCVFTSTKKQLLSQYNEYKTKLSWYEVMCGCQFSANSEVSGHSCLASPLPFMCPKRRVVAFVQRRALDVTGSILRCFSLAPKKLQNPQKLEVNHRSFPLQNLSDKPWSFKSSLSYVITSYELWCDVLLTYME